LEFLRNFLTFACVMYKRAAMQRDIQVNLEHLREIAVLYIVLSSLKVGLRFLPIECVAS
jgi:hypothetical protein